MARVPAHAGPGRGYAHRVSSALRAWLGQPSPRTVDVALTVAVGGAGVGTPVDGQYAFPIMVVLYTIGSTRSWEATIAAAAAVVATGLAYILAGGPDFTYDDLLGVGLVCAVS